MGTTPTQPVEIPPHPMARATVISLGIYFTVASLLMLYLLIAVWPPHPSEIPLPGPGSRAGETKMAPSAEVTPRETQVAPPSSAMQSPLAGQPPAQETKKQDKETQTASAAAKKEQKGRLEEWAAGLGDEKRLLLIVALAGALGAYVYAAQSFVSYVGNRQIVSSWLWWYLLRPFIGLALAEILYLGVRGGFFSFGTDTKSVNHFGVAALAGLTGMFSKEATDKLHEVFKNFFRTEKEVHRKEKLQDS